LKKTFQRVYFSNNNSKKIKIEKKSREEGPVFVAAFIPVVQIIVSVIDFCILHEQLYLGRYCTEVACLLFSIQAVN
jgi:hypothetical protein